MSSPGLSPTRSVPVKVEMQVRAMDEVEKAVAAELEIEDPADGTKAIEEFLKDKSDETTDQDGE